MKERLQWIDIAKGICMISVIMGHLGASEFSFVYAYHLVTFFILSGYTLRKKALTGAYLKDKFVRLMVPYFITCATVTVIDVINAIVLDQIVTTKEITGIVYNDIVRSFFASGTFKTLGSIPMSNKIVGAIWFLPAMFFAILIAQFLLNIFQSKKAQLACGVAIAAVGSMLATVIWLPFSVQSAMLAVPFVLVGKYLKDFEILDKLKWWHFLLMAAVFAAGCYTGKAQVFYMVTCKMEDWFITPLCSLCSGLLVIGLARLIKHSRLLEFIGKNSLIVLCVHLVEMNTLSYYFKMLREAWHWPEHFLIILAMKLVFILPVSAGVVWLLKRRKQAPELQASGKRDYSLDIMRSLMIILMIVGHEAIDGGFSRLIYSIHMPAFVMISGYFFKSGAPLLTSLKKTAKGLLPYAAFVILWLLIDQGNDIPGVLRDSVVGLSFSKNYFTWASSVGPVYFILLLFVTKLVYIFVDKIKNEWLKHGVVVALFLLGVLLGESGVWLPWSADCALFSLLFYHIAHYMRRWNVLEHCRNMPQLYFVLSCLWAFMIYSGSMGMATRRYGNLGITVIGVVAAFLLIYILCDGISKNLSQQVCKFISIIGQSTAYILIIHDLFKKNIGSFVNEVLQMETQNIFYVLTSVAIHVLLGMAVFGVKKAMQKLKTRSAA